MYFSVLTVKRGALSEDLKFEFELNEFLVDSGLFPAHEAQRKMAEKVVVDRKVFMPTKLNVK